MGGLAASFLGGLSIRDGAPLSRWTWAAVGSFVVLAALCIGMLWPKRFHVAQDPADLVAWVENLDYSPEQSARELTLCLDKKYEDNRPGVDRLGGVLFAASIALLVEIAGVAQHLGGPGDGGFDVVNNQDRPGIGTGLRPSEALRA